jgi:hypothetical protein
MSAQFSVTQCIGNYFVLALETEIQFRANALATGWHAKQCMALEAV